MGTDQSKLLRNIAFKRGTDQKNWLAGQGGSLDDSVRCPGAAPPGAMRAPHDFAFQPERRNLRPDRTATSCRLCLSLDPSLPRPEVSLQRRADNWNTACASGGGAHLPRLPLRLLHHLQPRPPAGMCDRLGDLSRFMKRVARISARPQHPHRTLRRVLERTFHSTMIDGGEHLWNCLRYIDLNMVRAGSCRIPVGCLRLSNSGRGSGCRGFLDIVAGRMLNYPTGNRWPRCTQGRSDRG